MFFKRNTVFFPILLSISLRDTICLNGESNIKNKDFRNLVLSKYSKGERPAKIFQDLNGFILAFTPSSASKSILETDCNDLSKSASHPRTI